MANNCLVTKLKRVVENDKLKEFGKLVYKIASTSTFIPSSFVSVTNTVACAMNSYDSDSYFCDVFGNNIGTSVPVPANSDTAVRFSTNGGKFNITNPYTLTSINISSSKSEFDANDLKYMNSLTKIILNGSMTGSLDNILYNKTLDQLELNNNVNGDISLLTNQTNLITLSISSAGFIGNLSSLSGLTSIRQLILGCPGVSGNLLDLGSMTDIQTIHFGAGPGSVNISGSVEEFVNTQRQAGRATATNVVVGYITGTNIYYKGEPLFGKQSSSLESYLSWTADSITLTVNGNII